MSDTFVPQYDIETNPLKSSLEFVMIGSGEKEVTKKEVEEVYEQLERENMLHKLIQIRHLMVSEATLRIEAYQREMRSRKEKIHLLESLLKKGDTLKKKYYEENKQMTFEEWIDDNK